jgi:integrase
MARKEQHYKGVYEYPRDSGIWWAEHYDINGVRHREKAGARSNAIKLKNTREREKLEGKVPAPAERKEKILFRELIEDAQAHAESENDSAHVRQLKFKFDTLLPVFGLREVEEITRVELVGWLDKQKKKRKWTAATYNRWQAALSLIFRVGNANEKTERNPLRGVRRKHEDNGRCRYLSIEEEKELTRVLAEDWPDYLPAFLLSIHTGMRSSEQKRSLVGDYNPDSGMLTVHQKKDRNAPKVRYVPMTPIALEAYNKMAEGKKRGALLCVNSRGHALRARHWFEESLAKAKILDYHWHDNRHTACSRWVMGGVPVAEVSKYAGHATIQMTMRYSHLMPGQASRANDKMMSFYPEWSIEAGQKKAPQSETATATKTATGTSEKMGDSASR